MTYLGAERNIQFNTFDVEGKIELVVGGTIPQPGHHPKCFEPQVSDGAL